MEDICPVEAIGIRIWKIPNNSQDWPRTDRPAPVLGDRYSLTVASRFGILVLLIFLMEDG